MTHDQYTVIWKGRQAFHICIQELRPTDFRPYVWCNINMKYVRWNVGEDSIFRTFDEVVNFLTENDYVFV